MKEKKNLTLADCTVPIPLICIHCDKRFPKKSRIDYQPPYVTVHCPQCGCMTPFKLEKSA